jgi:hypothetical protein
MPFSQQTPYRHRFECSRRIVTRNPLNTQ